MARWTVLLTVAFAASLAGCFRPLASEADLGRESVNIPRGEFFGEMISTNGTMRLSVVPGQVLAQVSKEPVNCFILKDAEDLRESFLGGISLDLEWTATSPMTEALNVTVESPGYGIQSGQGTSPFHFRVLDDDNASYRTPLQVRIAPAGLGVPVPDQPITWAATVGILESPIKILGWRHCEVGDLIPPVPPASAPAPASTMPQVHPLDGGPRSAVPRTSSILAG